MIHEKHPDVVITDVGMPELNGIDLIARIREENIQCRFIIVSGYRQFEYAHKALKYNVTDYILKPIDEQELNDALTKTKIAFINEKTEGEENSTIFPQAEWKDKNAIRRIFLNMLLEGTDTTPLTAEVIEKEYGIIFRPGKYRAIQVKLDYVGDPQENSEIIMGTTSVDEKFNTIFNSSFKEDCYEILRTSNYEGLRTVINYPTDKEQLIRENLKEFYDRVKNIADLFIGLKVTVGVGKSYDTIEGTITSLRDSREAINYRLVVGLDRIIAYEDILFPERKHTTESCKAILEDIMRQVESLNIEGFESLIGKVFWGSRHTLNTTELFEICYLIEHRFFALQKELNNTLENEDYIRNPYDVDY